VEISSFNIPNSKFVVAAFQLKCFFKKKKKTANEMFGAFKPNNYNKKVTEVLNSSQYDKYILVLGRNTENKKDTIKMI
jgi:hypothetical protein